uniref:Putative secreted peptide n=1 Tax=Anopheles braziliensis TaxID=58242 RepID=A0A2M3ZRV0_9DIPT
MMLLLWMMLLLLLLLLLVTHHCNAGSGNDRRLHQLRKGGRWTTAVHERWCWSSSNLRQAYHPIARVIHNIRRIRGKPLFYRNAEQSQIDSAALLSTG